MFIFRFFAGIWNTVVRATVWVCTRIQTLGSAVVRVVSSAGRSCWNLLHAAWRHPFVTAAVGATLGLTWLVFGTVPLVSLVGVGLVVRLLVRYAVRWMFQQMFDPSTSAPTMAPVMPRS